MAFYNEKTIKITILVDNHAIEGLLAEHGLSLWIETEQRRILFDAGQGSALPKNAMKIGINLRKTDVLVLSHGHYDHVGGIPYIVNETRCLKIYCHPNALKPRYVFRNKETKYIGMQSESENVLRGLAPENLYLVFQAQEISEKVGITGFIPRITGYEDAGGHFYLDAGATLNDTFDDDMALWIGTDTGLIICVRCCHAGLINTLNYIRQLSAESRIRAIIGGFHLIGASAQRLDFTIKALQSMKPEMIIPCHCTGETAVVAMRDAFGKRVLPGIAGMTLEF